VHLVAYIIRICYDARSPERKISLDTYSLLNSLFTVVSKQITVLYIRLAGILMSINEDVAIILSSFCAYCSLDDMVSSNSELGMKQSVLWLFGKSRWKANVRTSHLSCCDISTSCILVKKQINTSHMTVVYFRCAEFNSFTNVLLKYQLVIKTNKRDKTSLLSGFVAEFL